MPRKGEAMTAEHKAAISAAMQRAVREGRHYGPKTTAKSLRVPHGTIAGYRGAKKRKPCHCGRCLNAWRAYIKERKAKREG